MAVSVTVEYPGYESYVHEYPNETLILTVKVDSLIDFGIDQNESYRFCLLYDEAVVNDMDDVDDYAPGPVTFDLYQMYEPGHG